MIPIYSNAALAIAVALIMVGTLNKMSGVTDNPIRTSVLLIFVGLLAQGLGVGMRQWDHYADTILYSGIASLTIASRRYPCGIPIRWRAPTVYTIAVAVSFYVAWSVIWK